MHALESSFIFSIYFIRLHYIYLIRKQMRIDAVPVKPPSPFAITVELAYTSIEVKLQYWKYSFYWFLKLKTHKVLWSGIKTILRPQEFYHAPWFWGSWICHWHVWIYIVIVVHMEKKLISSISWIHDLPYVIIMKVRRTCILLSKESNH